MINIDGSAKTFDQLSSTEDRNLAKPLAGFRKNLAHYAEAQSCPYNADIEAALKAESNDDSEEVTEKEDDRIDRFLPGYQTCVFEITERQFA